MVWNEHGGVFSVWRQNQTFHKLVSFIETAESYQNSAWSSRSMLSGHAHASKPCCIRAKSILTLDLLWNEVCKDTIRPQRKLWSLTSAQQRCGLASEAIASVVLVGNQSGENSFTGSHLLAVSEHWSEGRQHGTECVSTLQMMIEIRMFSAATEKNTGCPLTMFLIGLTRVSKGKEYPSQIQDASSWPTDTLQKDYSHGIVSLLATLLKLMEVIFTAPQVHYSSFDIHA